MKSTITAPLLVICFFWLFSSTQLVAQNNHLSIDFTYPIPVGDTFFSDFHGVGGLDIEYSQPLNRFIDLSGILGYSRSRYTENEHITSNSYRAILGLSKPVKISGMLYARPKIKGGFATLDFKNKSINDRIFLYGLYAAFTFSINIRVHENLDLGIGSTYEFIHINRDELRGTPYNQQMHSVGLGVNAIFTLE